MNPVGLKYYESNLIIIDFIVLFKQLLFIGYNATVIEITMVLKLSFKSFNLVIN